MHDRARLGASTAGHDQLRPVGTSLVAIELHKLRRGLDCVLRRREIDGKRVGVVGLSLGGFYTLMLMAAERRIKVGVASCCIGAPERRLARGELGATFYWPSSLATFADAEVAALSCPRPLMIEAGVKDPLLPIAQGRREATRIADYYARAGAADRFSFVEFDGGHQFSGEAAFPFLERWLGASSWLGRSRSGERP